MVYGAHSSSNLALIWKLFRERRWHRQTLYLCWCNVDHYTIIILPKNFLHAVVRGVSLSWRGWCHYHCWFIVIDGIEKLALRNIDKTYRHKITQMPKRKSLRTFPEALWSNVKKDPGKDTLQPSTEPLSFKTYAQLPFFHYVWKWIHIHAYLPCIRNKMFNPRVRIISHFPFQQMPHVFKLESCTCGVNKMLFILGSRGISDLYFWGAQHLYLKSLHYYFLWRYLGTKGYL